MNAYRAPADDRRAALAAWLALTAPGLLLTRGLLLGALIGVSWLTPWIYVAPSVRVTAVWLLLAHLISTLLMLRRPQRWPIALLYLVLLVADAGFCGVLVGVDRHLYGLAVPIAVAVLAMSFIAGGTVALACGGLATVVGIAIGIVSALPTPLILAPSFSFSGALSVETNLPGAGRAPAVSFPMHLSVETSFAGASAVPATPLSFPLALSVETVFAGVPVAGSTEALFVPALALVAVALCLGGAANLVRARRARMAVSAAMLTEWLAS